MAEDHLRDVTIGEVAAACVEDAEVEPVEADEAFLGAEPEVAVGRAEDGVNTTLRQALLGRPGVEVVLRQGIVRVEREHLLGMHTGAARRAKEREDPPKAYSGQTKRRSFFRERAD